MPENHSDEVVLIVPCRFIFTPTVGDLIAASECPLTDSLIRLLDGLYIPTLHRTILYTY
jgi:hypothetical protein